MERLIQDGRLTRDTLVAYCAASPLFRKDRAAVLANGIDSYLRDDHIAALHVLAPYVEDALRELVRIQGGSDYQPGRFDGLQEIGLGTVLEHPLVTGVLGEDTCFYLRVLLSDARGLNLRNRVAHGLIDDRSCSAALTDRLIHVLLLIAQIRTSEEEGKGNKPDLATACE
jgi:hypothetical protein